MVYDSVSQDFSMLLGANKITETNNVAKQTNQIRVWILGL